MSHPVFEIVTTSAGALSIRNKQVNEIMHNPVGPWKEANELYIEQSELSSRLTESSDQEICIFDVGLGAGANALATLHCAKETRRPVRLVSFEVDLELMRFAFQHRDQFAHFTGYDQAIEAVLEKKIWQQGPITWQLYEGDFLKTIQKTKNLCDVIFYDPYSPQMNREMWTTSCFKKLRQKCKPHAVFYNYSQATPIRAALLEAGFCVGYGIPTGLKKATTQAACDLDDLKKPLDQRWFERWKSSHTPLPFDCEDSESLKALIRSHKQFKDFA